jgi:hypothetical protein
MPPRRAAAARSTRALGAIVACAACAASASAGCAVDEGSREAQSVAPLEVQIADPVPTYRNGVLEVSVGEGAWVTFSVTPAGHLELVELRASDPDALLGRLGHGPFKFWLSKATPGEGGRRQVCALASDAADSHGDACFWAVP